MLTLLSDDVSQFPPVGKALAEPNGLLAVGGDLQPERLLHAYRQGIFPWYGEGEPIMWWSPEPRCVVPAATYAPNRTLRKLWRNHPFTITYNQCFNRVIEMCAEETATRPETWIIDDMIDAYKTLHRMNHAHSIEIWLGNKLVGGLYGLQIGGVFCGESMFSRHTGASKVAFLALVEQMKHKQLPLLDCQLENDHLMNLGASLMHRADFITSLSTCAALSREAIFNDE
ncbi:leucyl/phenylalanyl-tRNA--protein transferase [Echinimonas agarilytica]|uniref:Leucyl/phenylalanyl-tRNA--protein transferase n=1 Tax=Echinimonas agarilytica TaxID=1215918 RepID=A0AA41W871_9GAMM|nr:leucyl/phenylalanyl-tRNA--protein transferase [Echinimonas agarilytica]MCM2680764.1 leucyl/phenylalanyl-tRNA--protein transferase [Echinimonas agarilytica]